MSVEIRIAQSQSELARLCGVLKELRTHLTEEQLLAQINEQRAQGYQVAFAETDGEVLAVAGFVIGRKLAWGKHVYVDDLVTAKKSRSLGVGRQLMAWLKAYAHEHGCTQLHLDSGVQRFGAHRFYLRHGFDITSHHFSTADLDRGLAGST